ncbi:MAG: hypothetical protein FWF19_01125 [Euryarchaeota archaeon]|nr:hypothetical protein [Euryarchaeota archaeon]
MKRDNAFTGLEAAIVLIAFVVVAAIFSYVMLGAGFFATQKAQEVTYAGVKQTTSNLIPGGTLYGNMTADGAESKLDMVQISLTVPIGGQSQELTELLITFSQEGKVPYNFGYVTSVAGKPAENHGKFTLDQCSQGVNPDPKIPAVLVPPGNSCNAILYINDGPQTGQWFQLEIKPPVGAPTTLRKTIATGYKGGKLL